MTPLRVIITLRRSPLLWAVTKLPPLDVTVLLYLVAHACPTTARAWATPGRIAQDLGLTSGVVEQALVHLARESMLTTFVVRGDLQGIELGPLIVRDHDAPENLPIETDP